MFFRSIRFRLALWYFAILAVILVLFSGGIYFTQRRTLNENHNDSLRTRATLLQGLIDYDAAGRPTLDLPSDPRDPNVGENFGRLFDLSGSVLSDNSASFGQVPIDATALRLAASGVRDGRNRLDLSPPYHHHPLLDRHPGTHMHRRPDQRDVPIPRLGLARPVRRRGERGAG